jgi:uncharacterized DUF497 family protein
MVIMTSSYDFLRFGISISGFEITNIDLILKYHYNIIMNTLKFDWDKNKATKNLAKHKVSFEEAQSVFDDDFARLIPDPDHSEDEERFILLGLSCSLKVLVVVHCYKDEENIIRLISARKATKPESKMYKEYLL